MQLLIWNTTRVARVLLIFLDTQSVYRRLYDMVCVVCGGQAEKNKLKKTCTIVTLQELIPHDTVIGLIAVY